MLQAPTSRLRRARDRLSEPVGAPERVVAAVCFRRRADGLQVRLVRTTDGERWTFPKGRQRSGEPLADTASREASEQAGVTGVIVEQPLTDYRYARRPDDVATAFLLAVQSTAPARAFHRAPTWFDLAAATDRIGEGRDAALAQELLNVLEIAERELEDG